MQHSTSEVRTFTSESLKPFLSTQKAPVCAQTNGMLLGQCWRQYYKTKQKKIPWNCTMLCVTSGFCLFVFVLPVLNKSPCKWELSLLTRVSPVVIIIIIVVVCHLPQGRLACSGSPSFVPCFHGSPGQAESRPSSDIRYRCRHLPIFFP